MKLTTREIAIFGMLGAMMYASKAIMEALPNIHLIGVFIIAITVVYRKKALYPIYIFVIMAGLFGGFGLWWIPYLYIWAILWAITMLLPKNLEQRTKAAPIIYMAFCALHGLLFGILYAPAQAIMFGLSFEGMIAWILAGLPFDLLHCIGNFCCGALIIPLIKILRTAEKYTMRND